MEQNGYQRFFEDCLGREPFPYQSRLATAKPLPQFLNAPTGTGKTLAVLGTWLWRRFKGADDSHRLPRRLVYCLPLRTLVGQTVREARTFIDKAGLSDRVPVYVLMGGEKEDEWVLYPERECVIVGTQDMLLSRALNRGYAQSRYAWPRSFGLLNNDCFWVFDEVQLMSSALATSAQLDGLRDRYGTVFPCSSLWMSATLCPSWFDVPDFRGGEGVVFSIDETDLAVPEIESRVQAVKTINALTGLEGGAKYATRVAEEVLGAHRDGTQTLVVLNTVERARKVYNAISRKLGKMKGSPKADLMLVHSRFRRQDRDRLEEAIARGPAAEGGRILVSTQVVEAGVNITSTTLFTELAPWPAIVQRLGRCNRFGKEKEARAFWLDLAEKDYPPYEKEEIEFARTTLMAIEDQSASPGSLARIDIDTPLAGAHFVLRARDLEGLFDTSPDLSGDDTDVSRFIRESDSLDASVFWRDFKKADDEKKPARDELCPVPVHELRQRLDAEYRAWTWDFIDGLWRETGKGALYPGAVVMLKASSGGYSPDVGWDPECKDKVETVNVEPDHLDLEGAGEDQASFEASYRWVTLQEHSADTLDEVRSIAGTLGWGTDERAAKLLALAAALHDIGKSSPVFQAALLSLEQDDKPGGEGPWAKAPGRGKRIRYDRDYFRHELAGALALVSGVAPGAFAGLDAREQDLVIYLIASHHGRVRTSIRPVPGENGPEDGRRFALGVWDGDELPAVRLGEGLSVPASKLDLSCMELGGTERPSWTERVSLLVDSSKMGPFRLAFLEALLRAADARASIKERG